MELAICIAIVFAVFVFAVWADWGDGIFVVTVIAAIAVTMWYNRDTPEQAAAKTAAEAAARVVRETPHVIREADGCKVYEFEAQGRNHYFTRCPATTSTERNYTVSCGKNCTTVKQEVMVTDNK